MRVTNSVARKKRHKKILKLAKGYNWGRKKLYRLAKNATTKAGQHAYKHRREKKRTFRQLWILRISAALRGHNVSYSRFIHQMTQKQVVVNRKMLADIAVREPEVFGDIVKTVMA